MEIIRKDDTGPAVEDVQHKLASLGFLEDCDVSGVFDEATMKALGSFCRANGIPPVDSVDEKTWSVLIDASYRLGDRTLYLRMPYFHGNDVLELQKALSALGFACGEPDGIFGAYTELALRKFQMNLGLPADGIAGNLTYSGIINLQFSWEGKTATRNSPYLGFARAADVLEAHPLCLFGTDEFTRSVASRMSNLALATNPASKIMSAESLLVPPDGSMLLVHVVLSAAEVADGIPLVAYEDEESLTMRLRSAIGAASMSPPRIAIVLPGTQWEDASVGRSAQHFAITLLDVLCAALSFE